MKYFLLSLSLVLVACKSSPATTEETPAPEDEMADLEPFYCEEIAEISDIDEDVYQATTILSYELIQNCVCIKYQYSGCREGERLLTWDPEYNLSNRPEVMTRLLVRNAGLCEQLLTDSACFSMKRLKLVGNEVLVFFNDEENNLLLNFDYVEDEDQ